MRALGPGRDRIAATKDQRATLPLTRRLDLACQFGHAMQADHGFDSAHPAAALGLALRLGHGQIVGPGRREPAALAVDAVSQDVERQRQPMRQHAVAPQRWPGAGKCEGALRTGKAARRFSDLAGRHVANRG